LTIEVTGLKNTNSLITGDVDTVDAVVGVDAFDVPAATISRLQETDPAITYTAGWAQEGSRPWSARTAAYSGTAGAQATFTFTGTSISWLGARGPQTGIGRVFLDGVFVAEVDTYAPAEQIQAAIFTSPPLADGSHTLMIEVTGRKNAASTDLWILVDAFDVTSSGTRFQETDSSVTYSTGWAPGNTDKAYSEGTAAESATPGARATFTFTGTSISWISGRGPQTGIARVFLDGVFVDELDTYSATEAPQKSVFTATGLSAGSHTLMIEVTGRKNAASTDYWILVDAFDVGP
jgi:bacillopeptidase F